MLLTISNFFCRQHCIPRHPCCILHSSVCWGNALVELPEDDLWWHLTTYSGERLNRSHDFSKSPHLISSRYWFTWWTYMDFMTSNYDFPAPSLQLEKSNWTIERRPRRHCFFKKHFNLTIRRSNNFIPCLYFLVLPARKRFLWFQRHFNGFCFEAESRDWFYHILPLLLLVARSTGPRWSNATALIAVATVAAARSSSLAPLGGKALLAVVGRSWGRSNVVNPWILIEICWNDLLNISKYITKVLRVLSCKSCFHLNISQDRTFATVICPPL